MVELSAIDWVIVALCAAVVGISKTGIPGIGVVVVPLLADVLPTRASTGVLLPMLILADVFAVAYWRRHAVWSHLITLIPWALGGVYIGYRLMDPLQCKVGADHGGVAEIRSDPGPVNRDWSFFRDRFGQACAPEGI